MLNITKIDALIKAKKIKTTALADQIFGTKGKKSVVRYLEEHKGVTFEKVEMIADALGVPVDYLRITTYSVQNEETLPLNEENPVEAYTSKKLKSMKNNDKRFNQFIKFVQEYVSDLKEENELLRRQLNVQ